MSKLFCLPIPSCRKKSKSCKKGKDKEHKGSQNEESSVQRSDEERGKYERKMKERKGSQNEKLLSKRSHDEKIKKNPERTVYKGSPKEMLPLKRSHDEEIKEYPIRKFEDYGDEMRGYEKKNQKHNEERERLEKELEESENEKAALKFNHEEEMGVLKNQLRDLKESLKKQLEESEHEIKKWKDQYNSVVQEKGTIEEEPQSLRSAEAKINQLTRQLEDERKATEEAVLRKSEEYMNEKSTLEQNHQKEIKNLEEEIQRLKERLTIDKSSYEKREKELKTKCDELKADIASYKENWTKSEDAKIQLDIKITALEEEKRRTEGELKRLEAKNNQLTDQLGNERKAKEDALLSLEEEKRRTEGELKRTQAMYNQLRTQHENEKKDNEDARLRLEAKNNQLSNQLGNERKAKEDALLRLSSMASNKLRDNNPNIADLSDPNRPTKLSEQFSELYDNEWTDAFDELEKLLGDKDDKEIISYLRDFILEIHSICSDISSSKLKTIEEAFVKPSEPSEDSKIPTEIFKTIKDGIKSMAPKLLEHTRKHVLGHLEEKYLTDPVKGYLQHQNVKRYIDKCTEVCWYMSVQDPQLVMDGSKSPDEKFDSNKHREYTKKGPYEEFVVWPVLYLYRGGQMLSKGVAQGGKKEMVGQQ